MDKPNITPYQNSCWHLQMEALLWYLDEFEAVNEEDFDLCPTWTEVETCNSKMEAVLASPELQDILDKAFIARDLNAMNIV